MKELITNALKAKGKDIAGKSDAELMDAYNQMVADEAKAKADADEKAKKEKEEADKKAKGTVNNNEDMPAWAKQLAERVDMVVNSLNANADKEKGEKRAVVKAKFGLDDVAVNALEGAALDGLFAKCHTSTGINSGFQGNANEQDQWGAYDLNAGMDEEKK